LRVKDIQERIESAIQKVGSTQFLFPIKSLLPDEITYEMIRCVAAANIQTSAFNIPEAHDPKSTIHRIVELGESRSSIALPELFAALKSEDGNVRRLAASALGKIKDAKAVQPLLDLLAIEVKPQVRQYAVKALGDIGNPLTVDLLTKISEDESEMYYTRDAAKSALLKCRGDKTASISTSTTPITNYHEASPQDELRNTQHDPISSFISSSHPRLLKGNWQTGFALDFHSSYKGADWNRSGIGNLVYRLKYETDAFVLPILLEHTRKLFAAHPEMSQFDIIIPVPSSTPREFSPVHEFCKAISKAINKPMQTCVIKTRQTQPQKEMHTLPQKRDNVAGAFAVNGDINTKHILLVDDLFDSGATLEEITRLLRKHGAANINVLTLTRTIHSDT
jgi:competence protein ComFC